MTQYYPPIEPFASGMLEVSDGHRLYWEEIGHPEGIPAVLIHGRWDISGPLDIAWALHRAWPQSELHILDEAGHGGVGFPEAMTAALDKFRQ